MGVRAGFAGGVVGGGGAEGGRQTCSVEHCERASSGESLIEPSVFNLLVVRRL